MTRLTALCMLATLPAAAHAAEDSSTTTTVTVTARKASVVNKIDKTVYDVSSMARAANGSAQDVLQATPELSVTADGKIAVKGNQQVTVLVDGKPTAMMSGSDEGRAVALQTMSGANIASIEVITNPSAAYSANGGAILNIVLKRHRKPGAHGQMQASASDRGLWNAGASGDATRGNLSVHGNLGLRHDGTLKLRQSELDWDDSVSGQPRQTVQSSEVFVRRIVQSAALGIDVTLSDKDSLSLAARYNARRSRPLFDVLNEERTGAAATIYHRISDGPNEQSDGSTSLSYSHHADGTALKAMVQRSDTDALIDKSYRDVFVVPARSTAYSHGTTRSARHLNQATLDWTRAWDQRGQWGMGLDLQDKTDDLYNYQAIVDPLAGTEHPDPATTNGYAVTTTVSAVYLTNRIREGKWEVLLGGRAERMALRVSPLQGITPTGHWQAFNPSLHLRHAYSEHTDLTLSYRRSLQMPDPRDLNPFTTYIDAQNRSRGNPGLKPQRMTSWEISANAGAAPLSGSWGAFYRTSRDTVTNAYSFDAGQVLLTSRQNGGQACSAGVTGALDWTVSPQLRVGMDMGAYRVMLDTAGLAGRVREHGVAGYLNLRVAYSVGPDELALDAHGQSAGITPLGRYGPVSNVNPTWKRRLTPTLSLTVNANDLFDGSKRTCSTDAGTFRQAGFDHFVARRLYVGMVRKFE